MEIHKKVYSIFWFEIKKYSMRHTEWVHKISRYFILINDAFHVGYSFFKRKIVFRRQLQSAIFHPRQCCREGLLPILILPFARPKSSNWHQLWPDWATENKLLKPILNRVWKIYRMAPRLGRHSSYTLDIINGSHVSRPWSH